MTSSQLFRFSGISLVVGAIAYIVYIVARSAITSGTDPVTFYQEGLWVPINVLGVSGAMLVLLGLPALYAKLADPTGVLGFVGVVLIAVAWTFVGIFLSLFGALIAPWLAEQAPALVATSAPLPTGLILAFVVGVIAELAGTMLLAIPFLQRGGEPHWVGYALPAAALLTLIGDVIAPTGPASNFAINLVSNVGPVLLMVGFAALGSRLWSERAVVGPARLPGVHLPQGSP
jgi:hypothetical protein